RNGVADRVTVINKSSGSLKPGVDLPARGVDVVVTELVDSGLLGERIIPVLADARARGLLAEGGRVIPQGACVYAAVLQSETIRKRSRLQPDNTAGLRTRTVGFSVDEPYTCEDLSRLEHKKLTFPTAVLDINFLEIGAVLMAPPHPTAPTQQQQASSSLSVERSGRADAIAVWFDLWLDEERGEHDVVSTRPERCLPGDASGWDAGVYFASGVELQVGGDAALEASAGRDCLHLTLNGNEGISTTQSAKPIRRKNPTSGSQVVRESAPKAARTDNDERHAEHFFLGEMDLARLNDQTFHESYATAVADILAINHRIEASTASATSTNVAGAAGVPAAGALSSPSASPAYVLDLYGAWSLAGLFVARLELEGGGPATKVLALCGDGEVEIAEAMNALARENGLESDRYMAFAVGLIEFASWVAGGGDCEGDPNHGGDTTASPVTNPTGQDGGSPEHDGREWSVVIASGVVEGSGLLRQGVLGDLELCRRFICAVDSDSAASDNCGENRYGDGGGGPGAAFVPGSLEVVCQGLQRASLLSENRVLSSPSSASSEQRDCCRCCGVDVTPVNAFGVANFRELDLSRAANAAAATADGIRADPNANPTADTSIHGNKWNDNASRQNTQSSVETCSTSDAIDHNRDKRERVQQEEDEEVFLTKPAVTYKLDLSDVQAGADGCTPRRSAHLPVARRGTLHAIAYWYRQRLFEPRSNAVAGGGFPHFRQAAVLLDEPVAVDAGQVVDLNVFCTTSQGVVIQVSGIRDGG
ncbi:unnamed protein product, partial [Sphacelaria rigidula]